MSNPTREVKSEYEILLEEYRYLHGCEPRRRCKRAWPEWSDLGSDRRKKIALRALYRALHNSPQSALCLSGGGIRSATFALGVIQRLAELRILPNFHFLSTVSGGGYIGSWLSSFARRDRSGLFGVQAKLAPSWRTSTKPEPDEIRHLREYSNYLSPRLGILSGDTWAVIGTYLRNVSLMWTVLVPLFVAALAVPRLLVWTIQKDPPDRVVWLTIGVAVLSFILALIHLAGARPVGGIPRYWFWKGPRAVPALDNRVFLIRAILPLTLCSIALMLVYAWRGVTGLKPLVVGAVAAGVSVILVLLYMWRYMTATDSEARQNVVPGESVRRYSWKKFGWEIIAAVASGVAGALAAYWLFPGLFPRPLWHMPAPRARDWLAIETIFPRPSLELFVCFGVPIAIFALLVDATIFIAVSARYNEEYDREWWARSGAWCLVVAAGWMAVSALSLFGPVGVYFAPRTISGIGMIAGGFAAIMGRSPKTGATAKQKDQADSLVGKSLSYSLSAAVPIFGICLLAILSLGTSSVLGIWVKPPTAEKEQPSPLLERTSWHYEATSDLPRTTIGDARGAKRKYTTIPLPAEEGDKFAARLHIYIVEQSEWWQVLIIIGGGLVVSIVSSFFVGVNRFSMHGLYRNRLVRAFLGASNAGRRPNPFTGFDPSDNLKMAELHPDYVRPEEIVEPDRLIDLLRKSADSAFVAALDTAVAGKKGDALKPALAEFLRCAIDGRSLSRRDLETLAGSSIHHATRRPMHVVNMALNLVSGDDLAWQERKAESFTATPLHCGSARLGYRPSHTYAQGLTLGTAVTISGAAASPNMGYHSSTALAFLLTFFNVRLGAWLGNPGKAGERSYHLSNPRWTLQPLIAEIAGTTTDKHPYVYLSDGGHFENLGLYEMVRRRCRWIVLTDAGEDEKFAFEDLGNAIRKIRIDLGINVVVTHMGIYPRTEKNPPNPKYCAVAEIHYRDVDGADVENGLLLYMKPTFYGKSEPKDIYNYAAANQKFPHEPTADQFFSESQFESYRALGYYAASEICAHAKTVEEFVKNAERYAARQDRPWMAKLRDLFSPGP